VAQASQHTKSLLKTELAFIDAKLSVFISPPAAVAESLVETNSPSRLLSPFEAKVARDQILEEVVEKRSDDVANVVTLETEDTTVKARHYKGGTFVRSRSELC
jgi:hypothetical protein